MIINMYPLWNNNYHLLASLKENTHTCSFDLYQTALRCSLLSARSAYWRKDAHVTVAPRIRVRWGTCSFCMCQDRASDKRLGIRFCDLFKLAQQTAVLLTEKTIDKVLIKRMTIVSKFSFIYVFVFYFDTLNKMHTAFYSLYSPLF